MFGKVASFLLLLALLPSAPLWAKDRAGIKERTWTTKYDPHFRKYSKRYFGPNVDWRWFKAQGIAESALKDDAKSHKNAKGIMQILPSTFDEIRIKNPQFTNIHDPRWNIAAGVYYDRQLYRRVIDLPSFQNRLYLTFAGYNAGYGGVLKAIKQTRLAREKIDWRQIKSHLPRETQGYVSRIIELKTTDLKRR